MLKNSNQTLQGCNVMLIIISKIVTNSLSKKFVMNKNK